MIGYNMFEILEKSFFDNNCERFILMDPTKETNTQETVVESNVNTIEYEDGKV